MKIPEPISYRRLYTGPGILLMLILVVPWLARGVYTYLLPLIQLCGLYAILVTGLTLLMGYTGQVSLGHAGFYGFGAYVAAVAVSVYQVPLGLAIGLALVASGLLACVTGCMVLRLHGHFLALATLCLGIILTELIGKSKITGGAAGLFDLPALDVGGVLARYPVAKCYLIWAVAWGVVLLAVHLGASPSGRAMRAVHGDEAAAAALGVPVFGLKLKVFVFSGVLAALSGVLYAFVYSPSYLGPEEFSLMLSVLLVTMVVIGGMGSVWGGLVGTVVMTGLHELIMLAGEKAGFVHMVRFEQLIFGLLLVVMLTFCPRGLWPALTDRWRRRPGTQP